MLCRAARKSLEARATWALKPAEVGFLLKDDLEFKSHANKHVMTTSEKTMKLNDQNSNKHPTQSQTKPETKKNNSVARSSSNYVYDPKPIIPRNRPTASDPRTPTNQRNSRNESSRRWRRARRAKEIEVLESVRSLEKDIQVLQKEIGVYEERIRHLEGLLLERSRGLQREWNKVSKTNHM